MQSHGPWTTFERLHHQPRVALQKSIRVRDQAKLDMDHIRGPMHSLQLHKARLSRAQAVCNSDASYEGRGSLSLLPKLA